jgi:hypothetical protein
MVTGNKKPATYCWQVLTLPLRLLSGANLRSFWLAIFSTGKFLFAYTSIWNGLTGMDQYRESLYL